MRILHIVTRSEFGGAQSILRTLAEAQAAAGYEVAVAAGMEGEWEAFRNMDARIIGFPIPELVRAIHPTGEAQAIIAIARLYRHWKPDITHLHTSKAGALGRLAPGMPRRRIVYTMHGYDQIRVENATLLGIDKMLRPLCGAVVAVSLRDADAMSNDGYKVEYIPNGVRDPLKDPPNPSLDGYLKVIQGIKASGLPIILVVAREARPKRIDIARSIALKLQERAQVIWIGGQAQTGDPGNFHALGTIADAAALYAHADIFFLPSDHEGMPLSVLEAMAAGLPVVASATGGIPEILQTNGTGTSGCGYTLPNDVGAMANALSSMAANASLRKEMGKVGRQIWMERYSSGVMANAYEKLYRKLLLV